MMPKILIIDDESFILNALQIFLEQAGYSVEAHSKYEGILDKTETKKLPDLIILDILLMNEDGRAIAKKLKTNLKTKHIPIILISAHPTAHKTSKHTGADAFLSKPFDAKLLLRTVDRLCRPKKKQTPNQAM